MRIFLDVGAHRGQTARVALDPQYAFDRVISFEPAPSCWADLETIDDPRFAVCRFALSGRSGTAVLHDPGTLGASVYPDLDHPERGDGVVPVTLVRASDWFSAHVSEGDVVFVKLNCEGSECDILEDLLGTGEIRKAYNVMVAFDVRRSPSLRGREAPLRRQLRAAGNNNIVFSEDVMHGSTHEERIRHWLSVVGARDLEDLDGLRVRYGATLERLSRRSGRLARIEQWLRMRVFVHLPRRLQATAKFVWSRLMRGRREGPV